jgi:hypothetical protein
MHNNYPLCLQCLELVRIMYGTGTDCASVNEKLTTEIDKSMAKGFKSYEHWMFLPSAWYDWSHVNVLTEYSGN